MRTKFKVDQRVFDFFFGWGTIKKIETKYISVLFDKKPKEEIWYHLNGTICEQVTNTPTLATKEYTLSGFTQEPQINCDNYIGKWYFFSEFPEEEDYILIGKLESVNKNGRFHSGRANFAICKPLTEEQIKILGLE